MEKKARRKKKIRERGKRKDEGTKEKKKKKKEKRKTKKIKGAVPQKLMWAINVHSWYHLFGCETHANIAITAQSWNYLVYLRDLSAHKDHLPDNRMTSQPALLL